jgi:hypothetical protein
MRFAGSDRNPSHEEKIRACKSGSLASRLA